MRWGKRTPDKTAPIAEWARSARRSAGYPSANRAAEAAGVPANWLRGLGAGYTQEPSAERIAALERLYGVAAPEPAPTSRPTPRTPDEEALASLVLGAYERGLREGLRIARDGGSSEPPQ